MLIMRVCSWLLIKISHYKFILFSPGVKYDLESKNNPGFPVNLKMTLNEANSLDFTLVPHEGIISFFN